MALDSHLRIQELLEQAARLDAGARIEFLKGACGADEKTLREACSLLPHYLDVCGFEPGRPEGPGWLWPGASTIDAERDAAERASEAEDYPQPPFCVDQYRCEEIIGRGGMGVVYRARHATLRKEFAIKLLRRGLLSPENRWRFAFEGELLRCLHHPGIARIFHVDDYKTPHETLPCYIMELIAGAPITRFAEARRLDPLARLVLLAGVCDAIEYAHHRGIVHRDLKPSNILVNDAGAPKVLDFGIARVLDFAPAFAEPGPGRFTGTYAYASPEQKRGEELTPASDVYALGLIAFELLAQRPVAEAEAQSIAGAKRLALPAVREIGEECGYFVAESLARALHAHAGQRFASAGALGVELRLIAERFAPSGGWAALARRLSRAFRRGDAAPGDHTGRALKAVLRTRIASSLRGAETSKRPPEPPAAGSAGE